MDVDIETVLKVMKKVNPSIRKETNLITSGDYNSIEIVTLVVMLESAFDIMVRPADITPENFDSAESILDYVNQRKNELGGEVNKAEAETYQSEITYAGNLSEFSYPKHPHNVLDFLENAAAQSPSKVALRDSYGNRLTFAELLHSSQAIGTYICDKYACSHRPFIVLERRNVKSLVMFLGVIWSGNYYVALDESFEEDRLHMMIDIVKPVGMLWHYNATNDVVGGMDVDFYDEMVETSPKKELMAFNKTSYCYGDPLYGVFTSGTTGIPKCIVKSHGAMVDFITDYVKLFGFDHTDVLGSKLSLMFDAITKDMYTMLYCASTLHLMRRGNALPPDDAAYINRYRITSVVWSPSLLISFAQLHILENIPMPTLRRVLFVGEALPAKYMNYWLSYKPGTMFVNLYGTSEMTGNCLYEIVEHPVELDVVPLNRIYPSYDVFLLDDNDEVVTEFGRTGEICVGGDLLCIDQLGKPLDPEKFTANPLPDARSERIYRTGDIVKIDEDGNYIFLSRKDYRFKHAGYRIDPGEIEAVISRLDFVEAVACLYDSLNLRIVLFWAGSVTREEELYQYITETLPPHMLPGKYVYLEKFPLNNNGKTDKAGLMNWIQRTKGECEGIIMETNV